MKYKVSLGLILVITLFTIAADAGLHIVGYNTLSTADYFLSVAIQSDGKMVVAGFTTSSKGFIARYTADGVLDNDFGTGGVINDTNVFNYREIAIQSDGKIVAVGLTTGLNALIARYTTSGVLDETYGTAGKTTEAGALTYHSIALQSDGKAVVVGDTLLSNAIIARYDTDGALDGTYGTAGKTTDAGASAYRSVALDANGKAVVVGQTTGSIGIIARYGTTGSLDGTYGSGGSGKTTDAGSSIYERVKLDSNGKAVVVGQTTGSIGIIARYGTTGSLDGTYGTSGKSTNANVVSYNSLAIQSSDDYAVTVGYGTGPIALVSRYDTDGDLDTSFDTDGTLTNSDADYYNNVAIQSDGKIVVVGDTGTIGIIARYSSGGALDTGIQTVTTLASFVDLTSATYLKESGTTLDLAGGTIVAAGETKLAALTGLDGSLDGITKANITTLKLGANLITAIPANIFSTFTNLQTLELQDNTSLVTINANSFNGLSLTDLRFDGCTSLVTLPSGALNGLSLSGTLNFGGNTAFTTFASGWNTGFTLTGNFKINGCSSLATIPSEFYTTCITGRTITGDIRLDGIAVTSFPENVFENTTVTNDLKIDSNTALTSLNKRMFKNAHIARDLDISGCTSLTTIEPLCFYNATIIRNVDITGTTNLTVIPFNLFQAATVGGSMLLNTSGVYAALSAGADKTALAAGVSQSEFKQIIKRHHQSVGDTVATSEHAELIALNNKTLALNHAKQR